MPLALIATAFVLLMTKNVPKEKSLPFCHIWQTLLCMMLYVRCCMYDVRCRVWIMLDRSRSV